MEITARVYKAKGFSLIEIAIVVVLIGVLAALALPAYQNYIATANMTKVNSHYEEAVRVTKSTFVKANTQTALNLTNTVPTNTAGWIALYNPGGNEAPGGGPAYGPEANAETGQIGIVGDLYSVEITIPKTEGRGYQKQIIYNPERPEFLVPVHYATNRTSDLELKSPYFGDDWSEVMSYGKAMVSIPPKHQRGELERPFTLFSIKINENSSKHVVIKSITNLDQSSFHKDLSTSERLLVFIHGYNTTFEDAVLRTGQLAFDLSIENPVLSFSWPSQGNILKYFSDLKTNERSIPQFRQLLADIKKYSGINEIDIIAHSMGNQVFTKALTNLTKDQELPILKQVILASPDIDRMTFETEIAPILLNLNPQRITLYASSEDKALIGSDIVWEDPRVGYVSKELGMSTSLGIDSIDISNVDSGWMGVFALNHSAYGDELIGDIFLLLKHDLGPKDRNLSRSSDRRYWVIPR